jgi:hypothetical protein
MVHPEPEREPARPDATAGPEAAAETGAQASPGAEGDRDDVAPGVAPGGPAGEARDGADDEADGAAGDEEEREPDPVEARRTADRLLWTSAWLTVMVGVFMIGGLFDRGDGYNALAWAGAVVAILGLGALIFTYVLCARDRITLRTHVTGPFDVFKGTTVLAAIVVICGLLAPSGTTSAFAVLLPWAVTYWLYGLQEKTA